MKPVFLVYLSTTTNDPTTLRPRPPIVLIVYFCRLLLYYYDAPRKHPSCAAEVQQRRVKLPAAAWGLARLA